MEGNTPSAAPMPSAPQSTGAEQGGMKKKGKLTNWMFGCCNPHAKWAPIPLRIVLGLSLMLHGADKLFGNTGIDGFTGFLSSLGVPAAGLMAWVVALVEFVGGIGVLIGFLTPLFACLIGINMLVAYFLTKLGDGVVANGILAGELDLALLAMALALKKMGAGPLSVDQKVSKKWCSCEK